jgi:hypothetical protein
VIPQLDLAQLESFCAEQPEHPCCPRCGERLRGMYDLAIGVCGLCKDDELNKLAKETGNPYPKGRW